MSIIDLHAKWRLLKDKLQNEYPELEDSDLTLIKGQEDAFFTRLESRTGRPRKEIIDMLDNL